MNIAIDKVAGYQCELLDELGNGGNGLCVPVTSAVDDGDVEHRVYR